MVRLSFNARLYDIKEAFERRDLGPLVAYLRNSAVDPDIQEWLADRIDSAMTGGHKLVIKGPKHQQRGGKSFDDFLAVAEAMNQIKNDPADQRTEEVKVQEVAAIFGCSDSKTRKAHRAWTKAKPRLV
jgi:hypothetical protein